MNIRFIQKIREVHHASGGNTADVLIWRTCVLLYCILLEERWAFAVLH
jgi:hypothetical protein